MGKQKGKRLDVKIKALMLERQVRSLLDEIETAFHPLLKWYANNGFKSLVEYLDFLNMLEEAQGTRNARKLTKEEMLFLDKVTQLRLHLEDKGYHIGNFATLLAQNHIFKSVRDKDQFYGVSHTIEYSDEKPEALEIRLTIEQGADQGDVLDYIKVNWKRMEFALHSLVDPKSDALKKARPSIHQERDGLILRLHENGLNDKEIYREIKKKDYDLEFGTIRSIISKRKKKHS